MSNNNLHSEFDGLDTITLAKGAVLFRAGEKCRAFLILKSGTIRVDSVSQSGNKLLIYRVSPNNTCVMTTACLLSGDSYCAQATVETEASFLAMPSTQFLALMDHSSTFRSFVFSSFSQRLTAVMAKVEVIASRSVECRLADALLYHAKGGNKVKITHELLAADIVSAREVVSRKLARWESTSLITRGRGEITLQAIEKLEALASNS